MVIGDKDLVRLLLPSYIPSLRKRLTTLHASRLNPRIPFISLIFPIPSLSAADPGQGLDQLNLHDILRLFVPQLPLEAEPERGTVWNIQRHVIELIGQHGLRMIAIGHRHALVVSDPSSSTSAQ
jgi:hypothetical protein